MHTCRCFAQTFRDFVFHNLIQPRLQILSRQSISRRRVEWRRKFDSFDSSAIYSGSEPHSYGFSIAASSGISCCWTQFHELLSKHSPVIRVTVNCDAHDTGRQNVTSRRDKFLEMKRYCFCQKDFLSCGNFIRIGGDQNMHNCRIKWGNWPKFWV